MNNRDYKNFAKNTIWHIYNRGNNKEKIFLDEQDFRAFLLRLGLALGFEITILKNLPLTFSPYSRIRINNVKKGELLLHSFCLMPNHFHLLIEQTEKTPINKLISSVCTSYAKYINKKYGRVGHVFQDKFKAVLIENQSQLMWVSAYIHMNPVKDKLVKNAEDYVWSSYTDYTRDRNDILVEKNLLLQSFGDKESIKEQTALYYVKDGL